MMIDAFVLLAPVLLLGVVALLAFVGCGLDVVGTAVPPTGTLTASPTTIKTNESSLLSWTTTAALSASIDHGINSVSTAGGSISTGPLTASTVFSLMVVGNGGTVTASATVNVIPAPAVASVSPSSGPITGGTVVTISGANFAAGASVRLDGIAATGVTVVSGTTITATTPAHASGAVNVVVTNPDAQSGTLPNGFTYASAQPIAFVQVQSATPQTPSATVAVTYPAAQGAGHLNVVAVGWNDTVSTVTSVTDSRGNTYALAVGPTTGTGLRQSIYYAKNIAAGNNTVTVKFSQAAIFVDVRALEYSGLDTVNPLDVTAAAVGNNNAPNSGNATTTSAHELIFGAGTTANGFSGPGAGFTTRIITAPDRDIAEDRTVTTIGSYSATGPLSAAANWVMQMATFKGL